MSSSESSASHSTGWIFGKLGEITHLSWCSPPRWITACCYIRVEHNLTEVCSELIAEMCCLIRDGHGVSIRLGTPLHRRFPQTTTGGKISVIPLAKENSTLVMLDVILPCKSCWLAFSKVDMMSFIFPHSLYVSSTRGGLRFDTYLEYIVFIMAWSPLSHHVSLPLLMHLLAVSVPCSLAALFSSVDVKLNPTLLCFLSWITDYIDERSCVPYMWGTAYIS